MEIIKRSWRGDNSLATVFWGYYVAFKMVYIIVLVLAVSALPESIQPFVFVPGVLFLFPYAIWIFVSIWRCARNSMPVWRVLARVWVVLAIVGGIGRSAAIFIETYQYYLERAKIETAQLTQDNERLNYHGWLQSELNAQYMASITKDTCAIKTAISIDQCKSQDCIIMLGGVIGDCVTFAKGSTHSFCRSYDSNYLQEYCVNPNSKNIKCVFFQAVENILCGEK